MSWPQVLLVLVTARSVLTDAAYRLKSGVCDCCAYESRKPVRSVTGKDTRTDGEITECACAGNRLQVDQAVVSCTASADVHAEAVVRAAASMLAVSAGLMQPAKLPLGPVHRLLTARTPAKYLVVSPVRSGSLKMRPATRGNSTL